MAVQTLVLYGNRLSAKTTYSTNQDPQSFSAVLSDSASLSDAKVQQPNKALSESLAATDIRVVTAGNKILADASTLAELLAFVQNSLRSFTDSLIISDTRPLITADKDLTEFLVVQDWLSLSLQKANIWTVTETFNFAPSKLHLYGPGVYYGVDYYSSNPTVTWHPEAAGAATWAFVPAVVPVLPLYGKYLFGQKTFSSTPAVGWTKPVSTAKQAWTNSDGESHN